MQSQGEVRVKSGGKNGFSNFLYNKQELLHIKIENPCGKLAV